MKTLAKWILAGLAFALGVMAAEHCDAYTIRSIRSLNAAVSAGAGSSFTSPPAGVLPFYVPGGGMFWRVIINAASGPRVTFQIEGQMSDGTWVAIVGPYSNIGSTAGATLTLSYSFRGPWQDMRVNLTNRTGGSLTADIYVTY